MNIENKKLYYYLPLMVTVGMILLLMVLPTGFEERRIYQGAERRPARVLAINNNHIIDTGLIRSGEQICTVEILGGIYKGVQVEAVNMLNGSLEADKIFNPGDKAYVVISHQGGEIGAVTMVDHYRLGQQAFLAGCFVLFLILFAGQTGLRAILSFVLTILSIWKVLAPLYLKGVNPIWAGMGITVGLTILIIGLVYGFNRKALSAISGSVLGILFTCILGIICTEQFKIHGAIMPSSESLLYSGYQNLNLTQIFMASIFIGSSGAMMDLAVDITSAVDEVIRASGCLDWKEALKSGLYVGRSAMGTMTTTLLLAYSGGYIALLMVFMAQGTPIGNILNYKYISAEIIDTVVGSFGLVLVAPFTAFTSGILLTWQGKKESNMNGPAGSMVFHEPDNDLEAQKGYAE